MESNVISTINSRSRPGCAAHCTTDPTCKSLLYNTITQYCQLLSVQMSPVSDNGPQTSTGWRYYERKFDDVSTESSGGTTTAVATQLTFDDVSTESSGGTTTAVALTTQLTFDDVSTESSGGITTAVALTTQITITTSDIGDMTTTLVPGSCTFSSHGTNTIGSTSYSLTTESFSDCQSRCQLDMRCNGFTHSSFENSCRLHETSESQSAGLCFSCTFVSKNCIPSINDVSTEASGGTSTAVALTTQFTFRFELYKNTRTVQIMKARKQVLVLQQQKP
uniref:Uncharacterized protein LOC111125558 isoform X2 n=1 Tax=Crassostrea virginica TaxID=6565 RepID=A0A8B8DCD7_CRAVI|nr:uncharacterized protein LOC111125558 isoform X2 [Crassostrea virginica]